jgi:hypothetical protein
MGQFSHVLPCTIFIIFYKIFDTNLWISIKLSYLHKYRTNRGHFIIQNPAFLKKV